MRVIVLALGLVLIVFGLWGCVLPSRFLGLVRRFSSGAGYFMASALRIVLAIVFWMAAPVSRIPIAMQLLAGISLLAAIILIVIGRQPYERLLSWFLDLRAGLIRVAAVFVVVFGGFLIWLVT